MIFNLIGVILCGLTTPVAADFCGQTTNDCCEWSMLDGKITLGADYLYWKVQQDGIIPGSVVVTDTTLVPFAVATRRVHPDFKYDSGYRVKLGYELPCDCWDVDVCYTYVPSRSNSNNFIATSSAETFVPITTAGFGTGFADAFHSKWNITTNNIDLDIGRTVCFGECLKLRPHIGFRATWFDQKFHSFATSFLAGTVTPTFGVANLLKEKFTGYGVEGGLWGEWKAAYGLSIVGHVGGSILYSKFTVHGLSTAGTLDTTLLITPTSVIASEDSFHTATPTLDYFVGLQYADCLFDMFFKVHAGWEQHVLFDTNRFLSTGNLSAQGLTVGLDVGF